MALSLFVGGRRDRFSFGPYPDVSLKDARALLLKGINPKRERRYKRHALTLASEHTFHMVFQKWVEHRRRELPGGRQSTLSQILRNFDRDVLPGLGALSIYEIRRSDLLDVLDAIKQRRAMTTAEKVRTWLHQLFRFALVRVEGLEANPASDLQVVAAPKPPVTHNPFLRCGCGLFCSWCSPVRVWSPQMSPKSNDWMFHQVSIMRRISLRNSFHPWILIRLYVIISLMDRNSRYQLLSRLQAELPRGAPFDLSALPAITG